MSLRDQILAATDTPLIAVEVPEWNATVHIATMSGDEREAWENVAFKDGENTDTTRFRATLLAACIVDEQRARVFTDADIAALSAKNGAVQAKLYRIAAAANGLTKAKADELVKN